MPYCQKCGKEIGADDTFCEECGTPVAAPASTQTSPQATSEKPKVVYVDDAKKWKVTVGVLSVIGVVLVALVVWFAIQSSSAKADYNSMKSDYTTIQLNYQNLQNTHNALDNDYTEYKNTIDEAVESLDKYLDAARWEWCSELEAEDFFAGLTTAEFWEALDEVMEAPDDGNLWSAYDDWAYCTYSCDDEEYLLDRAIIEGLAQVLEGIGCQEWTWIME